MKFHFCSRVTVSLLLTLAMLFALLSACATTNQTEDSNTVFSQGSSENNEEGELTNIVFYMMAAGDVSNGSDQVVAEINKITEKEIGVHVDIQFVLMGDWASTVGLAISGGEQIDVCNILRRLPLSTMTSQNQLLDLKDLLTEYGPDLLELCGPYLDAFTIDGGIYGLPVYRDWKTSQYLLANQDVLDELGLTQKFETLTTWTEFEELLTAVATAKKDDGMFAMGSQGSVFMDFGTGVLWNGDTIADYSTYDCLGDGLYACHASTNGDGKVTFLLDEDGAQWMMKKCAEWKEKGLVYPDSEFTETGNMDLMGQGITFAQMIPSEIGADVTWNARAGVPVAARAIADIPTGSNPFVAWSCGIPITSEEPEAAVRFLNLVYTSSEIMTLLDWGVEGRDYVVKDGVACYPEDSNGSVPYHLNDFAFGNYFLALPWDGSASDFREIAMQDMQSQTLSPYLGFMLDTSELTNEVAAISAVMDQYKKTLSCGGYTDELYAEMRTKLEIAGLDSYLSAAQTQLDAWLASK